MNNKNFEVRKTVLIGILSVFYLNVCISQDINQAEEIKLIPFQQGNKWGLKNAEGKEIVPAKYARILDFREGAAAVNIGGKMKTEKVANTPFTYEKFEGGKWGFINSSGEEILPCKYEDAKNFSEGLAAVKIKNSYGFIDKTGSVVIQCIYGDATKFSEGLAAVAENKISTMVKTTGTLKTTIKDRKWGYIDKKGKLVIPFEYLVANDFEQGKAKVSTIDSDPEKYFINKEGKKTE